MTYANNDNPDIFGDGEATIIACTCWCEGTPVIRGLENHWLRQLAKDHRVVIYNRRGLHGDQARSNLENEVEGMRDLHEKLGADQVILLGGCEAAAIPIEYAARYPGQVRAMLLINGTPRMERDGPWPGSSHQALEQIAEQVATNWQRFFRVFFAENAVIPWTDLDTAFELYRQYVPADGAALAAFMSHFLMADVRDRLADLAAPTLIIHADNNEAIPYGQAEIVQTLLPNAHLHQLTGARHHIKPEFNIELAEVVRDFITRLRETT